MSEVNDGKTVGENEIDVGAADRLDSETAASQAPKLESPRRGSYPHGICGAKTRGGTPCQRRPCAGKTRCRLHGGKSTGIKTLHGKLAQLDSVTTHGRHIGQYRWALATPEERERLTALDLSGEIGAVRELLEHGAVFLNNANNLDSYEQLSRTVGGLAVRLRALVDTQGARKGGANFGTINNLQVNLASLSTEQLQAALRALETPELRPLAALLLPVLQQAAALPREGDE